ncbi:MAG: hypothetical protein K2N63_09635 [Lachnospiraceae bacterium]|nr:hypothetical protein [Lachnospiraceae bacterium]
MKRNNKMLTKCFTASVTTAALVLQGAYMPGLTYRAAAETSGINTGISTNSDKLESMMTSYVPQVIEFTDPYSGFTHPGVGVTKELLENVRSQVLAGAEPWNSYFRTMLLDSWFSNSDVGPARGGGGFNNSQFISDGSRAYAQALMYFITGNNVYRRNAMRIIRAYEDIDPESLSYFNDACIHTGIPTNRICIAAEILRYSTYEVTDGYTDAELAWTDEDTEKFISNFLSPEVEVFQYSPDRFMNQHLYTTIGAMSAYLFMDDAESYEKAVEWFTVNQNGRDQGFNGSIKRLFREITTLDEVGQKEGSGTPLASPVIQHVEMGRDQAHGCGDLTNSAILSRLMQGQGTKVDPEYGTVSTAPDAVDCFTFLNDRLVNAADFFFQYMLGYDTEWVPVPFAIASDGTIKDSYAAFAAGYRGRYSTINFWDFYTYYAYDQGMSQEEIEAMYPYFFEGYTKKTYTNWDNNDGGGDFWVFLPEEAAGDTSFIPKSAPTNVIPVENRGALVTANSNSSVRTDGDNTTYFHFEKYDGESRVAMNSAGINSSEFLFRVRTNGIAKLTMSGGPYGTIYLPDTEGEWTYVTYSKNSDEGLGDIYYFAISEMEGSYVDIDGIYINPSASGLDAVKFESGREEVTLATYIGASFNSEFGAVNTTASTAARANTIHYRGINLPDGASVNPDTGAVSWTPQTAGQYIFYIAAEAGDNITLKRINITVSSTRAEAVENAIRSYNANEIYTSASLKAFQKVLVEARSMAGDTAVSDAEFTAKLNELSAVVAGLELVSPLLKDDPLTDGTSLDFSKMNVGNRSTFDSPVPWLDGEPGTFVGFWLVEDKGCIMDFGTDYKISVNKFGFQARAGFSDRLAGVQVFGSNDRTNWERLTVKEAAYQQGYQTVDVAEEYHNSQYRYLMIKKTHEYADVLSGSVQNLLEFGELRIWGTRYETGNLVERISMSCDAVENGRIKMGDTVTLTIQGRDVLRDLTVNIHGVDAVITEGADHVYIASAVMNSADCKTGQVGFTLDYTKEDGTPGETFYNTTDGTSLFLVNSDSFINTGMLAAGLSASSGSWDGKLTPEQCAALLFDGNVTSFGDLKNQFGDYYVVDFGEGVSVSLTDVMMMPRPDHPARMNGTVIYGSNDTEHEAYSDKEWTALTPAVSGAAANTWSHIAESSILSKESYRFFKILGAENGDISEVEFYGTYHAEVGKIAEQIKELAVQEAAQSTLVYPAVPAGFTLSVASSSNEAVIGMDGSVRAAVEDTIVTLKLLVTAANGEKAETGEIAVTVKGLNSLITGIPVPAKGAAALTMPEVPDGFSVSVIASSDEQIVALGDGRITMPERDSLVKVKLKLVRASDGASVESEEYAVLIYGKTESGKLDVMTLAESMEASSGSWDKKLNAVQCAQQLFDGSTDTFGDLASGNTYTVDFGAGIEVMPTKFCFHPRVGGRNNTEYVPRMNGTYVQGSVDGINWVNLTAPLEGVSEIKYYEVTAEQFLNCGSFRYFRITGASSGNIAEVEVYGTVNEVEVPEVPAEEIDVKNLAASMTASSGDWNNTMTAEQCAQQLFDGDLNTFGDLKSGNTYTIDFGERATVSPVKFEVYPRMGTGNKQPEEFTDRLNGVKFQGSNDGQTWETLTAELSGIPAKDAASVKWHELTVITENSYRYIQITGGNGGNMAEVKMYGSVNKEEIPEVPAIDVKTEAASMTASSGEWNNSSVTAEQCAQKLFDGDLDTYGDLASGNTYTIDFGEGKTIVPEKFEVYPRKGSGGKPITEHVERLNGVKFQGSNDGLTWVDITDELAGITKTEEAVKWHELAVIQTETNGYRYIQITGGNGGNMAEVKMYGTVNKVELPETPAIDVKTEAASMTASSGEWNNSSVTAEQCAQKLFDGDLDTYGDLASGNTYTIDFGEGKTIVPEKFEVYPRKGSGGKPITEHVERLNGVKFQGSNDGLTWVDITDELAGITKTEEAVKWHELAVIQTETNGYRYIQITGGNGGNMAEVKMYGTVNLAESTTAATLPDQEDPSDEEGDSIAPGGSGMETPTIPDVEEGEDTTKPGEEDSEEALPVNKEDGIKKEDILPGLDREGEEGTMK